MLRSGFINDSSESLDAFPAHEISTVHPVKTAGDFAPDPGKPDILIPRQAAITANAKNDSDVGPKQGGRRRQVPRIPQGKRHIAILE